MSPGSNEERCNSYGTLVTSAQVCGGMIGIIWEKAGDMRVFPHGFRFEGIGRKKVEKCEILLWSNSIVCYHL